MIDFQVSLEKLQGFQTAQEIREFFQEQGVKGITCMNMQCPIATFIRQQTGESVEVDNYYILRQMDESKHYNTPAMEQFINDFDDEEYPELAINPEDLY